MGNLSDFIEMKDDSKFGKVLEPGDILLYNPATGFTMMEPYCAAFINGEDFCFWHSYPNGREMRMAMATASLHSENIDVVAFGNNQEIIGYCYERNTGVALD